MTKPKTPAANPKALNLKCQPEQSKAQALSHAALRPSVNCASVIEAYQGNLMGKEVDLGALVEGLTDSCKGVKDGDLSTLEAMLLSQATALQTIFASLARRAVTQEHLRQYEAFMGLALKAQAQSRATISALVDLKHPRQAMFVKQANIAQGPQQVNNGNVPNGTAAQNDHACAHGKETEFEQNRLLEADHGQPRQRMDTRAAKKAERSYQAVETVEQVHRAKKPRG